MESATQSVTVTNTGSATLNISDITISPSQFLLQSNPVLPMALAEGSSALYTVTFSPDSVGTFNGQLTFTSNAPTSPTNVALSGTGTAPGGTISITTTSLPTATVNASYTATLQVSGGTSPFTWEEFAGVLPPGLTLDAGTGTIAGIPTLQDSFAFTVQATDSSSTPATDTQDLTLEVAAPTGADCNEISKGFPPLNDLGSGLYQGEQGGLYPGGSNQRPSAHDQAGFDLATAIEPLDGSGIPDPNGSYVLLSIGMSNTRAEFGRFKQIGDADSDKNPSLVIVNGATPGCAAISMANPALPNFEICWQSHLDALTIEGVTASQVVAVWLKQAEASPSLAFPADAQRLQDALDGIVDEALNRFPNLKLVHVSSRIYAGYANTNQNPEPFAYQSGFAAKWLVESRLARTDPWVAWAPYLWADGLIARSDGLVWTCQDLISDGTHPSSSGEQKVADLLMEFFKNDTTARQWFLAAP